MKKAPVLAVLLAAAPVAAQPVTRPDACGASLAYAPDDVRVIVEDALRQEPSCNSTLELRIVPTDGGLYLFARDEQGRVRERLVPDAQSAAVLIASWMVDDSRPFAPPPPPPVAAFPKRAVPPPAAALQVDAVPAVAAEPKRTGIVIGGGPIFGDGDNMGARIEVDIKRWKGLAFGVAGQMISAFAIADGGDAQPWHELDVTDMSATGYVAFLFELGNWQLRPSLGAGFTYTRATELDNGYLEMTAPGTEYDGVVTAKEMSLLLGRRFGNFEVNIGPHIQWLGKGPAELQRYGTGGFYAALRYRL